MAHVGIVAAGVGGRVGFDVGTYEGCGEGAGIGAFVGFDVGTCEKSNGDHRRAVRVCRPPAVDATTQPHDASYVPFVVSAPRHAYDG